MKTDRMIELRHLRYFLAVAEQRHFGRAAKTLHIVQPALSMQIRALEAELGTPLFIRTSRRVELTEAGELLVDEARKTITQAERAAEMVRLCALGVVGRLRIGFSGNACFVGKLTSDLRRFYRSSPGVQLSLREMPVGDQLDAIASRELDVGYCPSFDARPRPGLSIERLGSWPWVIALCADHPLAGRANLHAAELRDEGFVIYAADDADDGQVSVLHAILGQAPHVSHRVSNTLTVLSLAASGLGIGLIPEPLASVALPDLTYRPLEGQGGAADLVLVARQNETSGVVRSFLALARVLP